MENGKPTSENEDHISEHDTILKKLKIDILLHLKEDKKIFHTISGPAGSGKTEIIKKLLTFLEDDKFKDKMDFVTVAAPTHSAVKNVMDRVQDIKIVYDHGTLHKLLSNGFDCETKKYRYKKVEQKAFISKLAAAPIEQQKNLIINNLHTYNITHVDDILVIGIKI